MSATTGPSSLTRMQYAAGQALYARMQSNQAEQAAGDAARATAAFEVAASRLNAIYRGGANTAFDARLLDALAPVVSGLYDLFVDPELMELDAIEVDSILADLESPDPIEVNWHVSPPPALAPPGLEHTPVARGAIARGLSPLPAVVAPPPPPSAPSPPAVVLLIGDRQAVADLEASSGTWSSPGDHLFAAVLADGLKRSINSSAVKEATKASKKAAEEQLPLLVVVSTHGVVTESLAFVCVPIVCGRKTTVPSIVAVNTMVDYVRAIAPAASLIHFDSCFSSCGQPRTDPVTPVTDTWVSASGARVYGTQYALLSSVSMQYFAASRAHFDTL